MKKRSPRGSILIAGLILVALIIPLLLIAARVTLVSQKHTLRERWIKNARIISQSTQVNFMRIFAADYYADHFDRGFFLTVDSSDTWTTAGKTNYTFALSPPTRSVYLTSAGTYLPRSTLSSDTTVKTTNAVIAFETDNARFGTIYHGNLTLGLGSPYSNNTFDGSLFVDGNLTIEADAKIRFMTGPVISTGVITNLGGIQNAPQVNFYCEDWVGNAPPAGNVKTFVPEVNLVDIDLEYYTTRFSTVVCPSVLGNLVDKVGSDIIQIAFGNGQVTMQEGREQAIPPLFTYNGGNTLGLIGTPRTVFVSSPTGSGLEKYAVILATGADVRLVNGTNIQAGRYTIVARIGADGNGGNVRIKSDLRYQNSPTAASPTESLAVLAEQDIIFDNTGAQSAVGLYYAASGNITKTGGGNVTINGSVHGILTSVGASILNVTVDPNLARFPPPKLPEKPVLVTINQR